jgi:NAD(P)-dependent dehydrogenase (short-subunit alcohol dehydrogenase family)
VTDARGRTVLVTGASSGIGRATALQLADDGADLVLLSRSATALADVQALCEARGVRAVVTVADVSDRRAVEAAFEEAQRQLGAGRVIGVDPAEDPLRRAEGGRHGLVVTHVRHSHSCSCPCAHALGLHGFE